MQKKIKLATIVGTRPEIIRLSSIIRHLRKSQAIEHILIHTGQNYDPDLNEVFFSDLDLDAPEYYLDAAGESASETIGKILIKSDKILRKIKPDGVLILGDTNSGLSAISAKKLKIPIFHYEAGNRCFDQRVPEETNRKIIDNVSDLNLTYSKIAKDYLINEGFDPDRVINIGSPMFEVLNYSLRKINKSSILNKLKIEKENYFLVSCHREENIDSDKNFNNLINLLNHLAEKYELPIIVSVHPRTKKIINEKKPNLSKLINLHTPFGFNDYNFLQINSFVVLSDSGTISEESSILNFKAINIRESHERPEAMEEAAVIMTGLNSERVIQGIEALKNQKVGEKRNLNLVKDYSINNISLKVERIIISYLDYINRVVWQKRILVYTNHYYPEQFKINDLVNWISKDDFEVRVITGLPNYPEGKIYKGYGPLSNFLSEIKKKKLKVNRLLLIPRMNGTYAILILNYISFFISCFIFTILLSNF